jgi:hypothetical protein
MIVSDEWTPFCGNTGVPETDKTKLSQKGKICKICNHGYSQFLKIKNIIGKQSDRSISKKYNVSERFIQKIRDILNILAYKHIKYENNEVFIPLKKSLVTHIEVNRFGIFRSIETHRQYSIHLNNNGTPYLHTRYRNYSASILVYNSFAQIPLQKNQTVDFKDGNHLNLNFDNLYARPIIRSSKKISKNLNFLAEEWLRISFPEDTRRRLALRIEKSLTYVRNRTEMMVKLLDLPKNKKYNLYKILVLFVNKDGENGKTGGKNERNEMFNSNIGA